MSRRNETSGIEALGYFFFKMPWWVGPIVIVLFYVGVRLGLPLIDVGINYVSNKMVHDTFSNLTPDVRITENSNVTPFFSNLALKQACFLAPCQASVVHEAGRRCFDAG